MMRTDEERALFALEEKVAKQQRWLLQAGQYIAATSEWFASTKRVPVAEIKKQAAFCAAIAEGINGDPPLGAKYDPAATLAKLEEVSAKLRERVGDARP